MFFHGKWSWLSFYFIFIFFGIGIKEMAGFYLSMREGEREREGHVFVIEN